MNKKNINNLIVNFRPFALYQEIDIYVNGECIKQDFVILDEITNTINRYCVMYDIDRINLCGNRNFVSKFKNDLITNYAYDTKEINIIER